MIKHDYDADKRQKTEPAMETGIAVIYEENLEVANVQSNDDFTIPNASQSYPDDLDLTEENFKSV